MLTTYLTTVNIWTYFTSFAAVFINNDMVFYPQILYYSSVRNISILCITMVLLTHKKLKIFP